MVSILRGMVLLRLTFVRVFWKTFQSNRAEVATHLEAMVEPGEAAPVAASPYTYERDTQRDTTVGRQRSESLCARQSVLCARESARGVSFLLGTLKGQ